MKGNLSQFEARVNDVIRNTYNNFKDDVVQAIGDVSKQKKANTRVNNKSVLVELEQEETR